MPLQYFPITNRQKQIEFFLSQNRPECIEAVIEAGTRNHLNGALVYLETAFLKLVSKQYTN